MAFVQSTGTTGTTNPLTLAFGSNVTAGNLLVVAVHWDAAGNFTSLTDTQGNSYTQAGNELANAGLGIDSRVYYAIAGSSAANTVSLNTTGGGVFRYITVHEYSGDTVFDTGTAVETTGSGSTLTSPSFNPSGSGTVFVFGVCSGTGSAPGGYNSRQTTNGNITEDKTVSAGSQTSTASQTGSGDYSIHSVVFNAGAAAAVAAARPFRPMLMKMRPNWRHDMYFPHPQPVYPQTANVFQQALDATVTTTASIVRDVGKLVNATATSTATITKQVGKSITANATATATLLAQKVILLALTATVTTTASIVKQVNKLMSATATTSASIVKQVNKLLNATVTTTATIAALKVILKTMTATVTTTATMVRQVGKPLTATVTTTGSIVKQVGKLMSATATTTASLLAQKVILKALTATVTTSATMVRRVGLNVTATVTTTASITKRVGKTMSATATTLASILTDVTIAGAIQFTRYFNWPRPGGRSDTTASEGRFQSGPGGRSDSNPDTGDFDPPDPGGRI